jgi:hypothetical protein
MRFMTWRALSVSPSLKGLLAKADGPCFQLRLPALYSLVLSNIGKICGFKQREHLRRDARALATIASRPRAPRVADADAFTCNPHKPR